MKTQIEVDGKKCEFTFSDRRIDIIEKLTGKSLVRNFYENNMMISVSDMKVMFTQTIKEKDGGYLPQNVAEGAFKEVLNDVGYMGLASMLFEAVSEDCPFFFLES